MKKLRTLHLYLGCIFAPLLLFFAVSGIWQMCGLHSSTLEMLSSIHTSRAMKAGTLTSPFLKCFVLLMAASFILTTVLGVVMALKYGTNRRTAVCCLAAGVVVPLAAVLFALARHRL